MIGSVIVGAVLLAVIGLAVRSLYKSHQGGGGCSGDCGSCGGSCGCH